MNGSDVLGDVKLALAFMGLIALLTLSQGCKSTDVALKVDGPPEALVYTKTVTFEKPLEVPAGTRVRDANDPKQIVMLALACSERGQHESAAGLFQEAATRFESRHKEFEVSCLAAAANEFLAAGQMDNFRQAIWQLRRTADKYQLAAADESVDTLLALGDIAAGVPRSNERTPKALKVFYKGNAQVKTVAKSTGGSSNE